MKHINTFVEESHDPTDHVTSDVRSRLSHLDLDDKLQIQLIPV